MFHPVFLLCAYPKRSAQSFSSLLVLWLEGGTDGAGVDAGGLCDGADGHLGRGVKASFFEHLNGGNSVQAHLVAVLFECQPAKAATLPSTLSATLPSTLSTA